MNYKDFFGTCSFINAADKTLKYFKHLSLYINLNNNFVVLVLNEIFQPAMHKLDWRVLCGHLGFCLDSAET